MKQFHNPINNSLLDYLKNNYKRDYREILQNLESYARLLREHNSRINLISRKNENDIFSHHIVPSIIVESLVDFPIGATIVDIGSGAGLPGIPLAICRPDLKLVLIDSIRKKHLFQKLAIGSLNLTNVTALHARLPLEENPMSSAIRADFAVARAVSDMETLISLSLPLLKPGGTLVAWKGSSDVREIEEVLQRLGLEGSIIPVPQELHRLSPKLPLMRIVRVNLQ